MKLPDLPTAPMPLPSRIALPDPRLAEHETELLHDLTLVRLGQGTAVARLRASAMIEAGLSFLQAQDGHGAVRMILRRRLGLIEQRRPVR